ncbi:NMDA receptor-regulated protein 1-domain-containing protein [Piptocephalis cylindrospora]|uniref:NMDA receptor-regulated protein 1-domain-containing protein n=1 Tax=Piptocephalis cylindrospora TaxID=1907219 RepID=A0A4P9Y2V6_9FUNG|nr:NMDA receptor-regulated protein 1-domain-containing protein [Piptocephalis cylindrospora]|eukprot:RKP13123.1 NMDA receptor-regulated protein 1-domain-containing protein [Piptocephalis cylindrospora]
MLQFEDSLHSHPFYLAASQELMECYLAMDKGSGVGGPNDGDGPGEEDTGNMTASELKKYRNKQRKAELKAKLQKEEEEKKGGGKKKGGDIGSGSPATGKKGTDGAGAKSVVVATTKEVTVEKPLEEAIKLWKQLRKHCHTHQIPTRLFVLAAQVYGRQGRPVLAAKCLTEGLTSPSDLGALQWQAASLHLSTKDQDSEAVVKVVREVCDQVLEGIAPKDTPESLEARAAKGSGVQDLVHAAQLRVQLGQSPAEVANTVVQQARALLAPSTFYKDALVVKDCLTHDLRAKEATTAWKKQCAALMSQAKAFSS